MIYFEKERTNRGGQHCYNMGNGGGRFKNKNSRLSLYWLA